jgi:Tol biopolymer transport system component
MRGQGVAAVVVVLLGGVVLGLLGGVSRAEALAASASGPGAIAFDRWNGKSGQVLVLSIANGEVRQLTRGPDLFFSPRWSGDGSQLALSRRGADNGGAFPSRIVVLEIRSGRKFVPLYDPRSSFGDLGHLLHSPALSPDGARLSFTDQGWNVAVVPSNRRSTQWKSLASGTDSAWSPDGRWLAFTRLIVGPSKEVDGEYLTSRGVWTMKPDGSGLRRITARSDWSPRWSPDGTQLVLVRRVRTGASLRRDIVVVTRVGRFVRKLVSGGSSPAWSPNGKEIAFVREDGIYTVSAGGGLAKRVHAGSGITSVDWGPEH